MKARTKKRTAPAAPIHTPLTVDDRDAVDRLHNRIEWQAILVQYTLEGDDAMKDYVFEERVRPAVKEGLIELCASIARDADALRDVLNGAEKRTHGAR